MTENAYVDEDLIPYYNCVVCHCGTCKDEVVKRIKGRNVVCLSCYDHMEEV